MKYLAFIVSCTVSFLWGEAYERHPQKEYRSFSLFSHELVLELPKVRQRIDHLEGFLQDTKSPFFCIGFALPFPAQLQLPPSFLSAPPLISIMYSPLLPLKPSTPPCFKETSPPLFVYSSLFPSLRNPPPLYRHSPAIEALSFSLYDKRLPNIKEVSLEPSPLAMPSLYADPLTLLDLFFYPYSYQATKEPPSFPITITTPFPTIHLATPPAISLHPITSKKLPIPLESIPQTSKRAFSFEESFYLNRQHRFIYRNLAELPSLEDLNTISLGDDFRVQLRLPRKHTGTKHTFSLALSPYDEHKLEPLVQHLYFVLDESVSKEEKETFAKGVIQALSYLHPSAFFNIISLGETWHAMSSYELQRTKTSIGLAKQHLRTSTQKPKASDKAFSSLIKTLQEESKKSPDLYTVILLSNGNFLKKDSCYSINQNLSIYAATINETPPPSLSRITKQGRGKLVHSQIHAAFPRKLSFLLKQLREPIAYNVHVSAKDPKKSVIFFQDPLIDPPLFSGKTYLIHGSAESPLEELDIIIQCQTNKQWFNIVKHLH